MDRAGPDDEEEALIIREDDTMDIVASFGDEFGLLVAFGLFTNEISARVSTTLMSEVFCMEAQLGQTGPRGASLGSVILYGQKSGRPLTPKRPAFAFLVTPKLPLGGRSRKSCS